MVYESHSPGLRVTHTPVFICAGNASWLIHAGPNGCSSPSDCRQIVDSPGCRLKQAPEYIPLFQVLSTQCLPLYCHNGNAGGISVHHIGLIRNASICSFSKLPNKSQYFAVIPVGPMKKRGQVCRSPFPGVRITRTPDFILY